MSELKKNIILLGSTGSVGTQTLQVIRNNLDKYCVLALSAGSNIKLLYEQIIEFKPKFVAIANAECGLKLKNSLESLNNPPEIFIGKDASTKIAMLDSNATVVNAITGSVGLKPTIVALENGSRLALANKESLVIGGKIVKNSQKYPAQVVPVDSEHSAISQCLNSGKHNKGMCAYKVDGTTDVEHIILTASGGPFRGYSLDRLKKVSAKDALKHPTWSMGNFVTINSATLMNKGLEVIEAHLLFDIDIRNIKPVVHPQSIVHSMVSFKDGSTIAQASIPDMKIPIALGLSAPQRLNKVLPQIDFTIPQKWEFLPVDNETFPAINVAKQAVANSDTHACVMNASNEVCVQAFLDNKIAFLDIVSTVIKVLNEYNPITCVDYEQLIRIDSWARNKTKQILGII